VLDERLVTGRGRLRHPRRRWRVCASGPLRFHNGRRAVLRLNIRRLEAIAESVARDLLLVLRMFTRRRLLVPVRR
jgi:hypothetical protein